MIQLENVTKRYGGIYALRDVSLTVEKGSVMGLLGQNGAGKTTLLNILTGYLAPTAGRALIDGRDPLLEPEAAKGHLGYLPEQPPLYDEMTVREYLDFAARLKGVKRSAIPAHVDEIMERCGLQTMQNRLLAHLSKGFRQRAGFAQALCGDPDVLVLDEPTVGLDPKQVVEIRGFIRSLGKGRTILFSSHIVSEVQQLCDHVAILHEGALRAVMAVEGEDEPDEITVLLTVAAGEESIVSRLKQTEGARRVTVRPSRHAGCTTAQIVFRGQPEPERRLFALCSGIGAPILELTRVRDSLEDVFLKAISDTL